MTKGETVPQAPITLFQFWDSGQPPEEVRPLMDSWRRDERFACRLYDEAAGEAYVAERAGPRAAAAFRACAFAAMQSDIFRYAALLAEGGLWMDADQGNRGGLARILHCAPRGVLMSLQGHLANGVIYVREPGSPLMARLLEQAVANIEARLSNNVAEVTGPMMLEKMYLDQATTRLFNGFLIEDLLSLQRFVKFRWKAAYKDTDADWRVAAYFGQTSIFRDDR